jgi:UDP-N-acetylglucosamine 2-epimerase (non-hydrolysing)
MCVVGTRPEAIKMAPVILELRKHPDRFDTRILATAQHRDMLDQVLRVFDLKPDVDLDIMTANQTLNRVLWRVVAALEEELKRTPPSVVIAQGDTTTVMAVAMACFHENIPFAHVEAGLRTGNLYAPYPEEFNRRVAGLVASHHFAPTPAAAERLLAESVVPSSVHVTGNTVIDALFLALERTTPPASPVPAGMRYILMTCHRREIFGEPIREVFEAVRDYASERPDTAIWYPVHPNPNVSKPARQILGGIANVKLTAPLDYVGFVHAMKGAWAVLTDSGGVQEEAPSLGKPVLVLRDVTERPEGVAAGCCRLVGPHRDAILDALQALERDPAEYRRMAQAKNPYGDGHASERIVSILARGKSGGRSGGAA